MLLFIHVDITHSCFGHDFTHVMLSCLSKLSNTTLVIIVVQSKMTINLVVNIVVFKKTLISVKHVCKIPK
jgi:hypothetical protein